MGLEWSLLPRKLASKFRMRAIKLENVALNYIIRPVNLGWRQLNLSLLNPKFASKFLSFLFSLLGHTDLDRTLVIGCSLLWFLPFMDIMVQVVVAVWSRWRVWASSRLIDFFVDTEKDAFLFSRFCAVLDWAFRDDHQINKGKHRFFLVCLSKLHLKMSYLSRLGWKVWCSLQT